MATYVLGDLHSCYKEFLDFLELVNFDFNIDKLIATGDLIDRSDGAKEVLDFFIQHDNFKSVLGNHDEKIRRGCQGNKINLNPEILDTIRQLGPNWIEYGKFLSTLPLYIPFDVNEFSGHIIHAGVDPIHSIEKQFSNTLLRMRTFPFETYQKGKEATAPIWQSSYKNPHLGYILHGHIQAESAQFHNNPFVYSLDGGCVFGGVLRGMRLEDRKIFEVPGRKSSRKHYESLDKNKKLVKFCEENPKLNIEKVNKFLGFN